MVRFRLVLVAVLLASGIAGACGSAHAAVASQFRVALTTPTRLGDPKAVARDNAYVVLEPWQAAEARALKTADPRVTVLVYQDLAAMTVGAGANGLYSSGVGYAQAAVSHPGWFIRSASGRRIPEHGYPYLYLADVGNRGYQHRWAQDVVRLLRSGPWDGVFMDEVDTTLAYDTSTPLARYPTDRAYERAVGAMLSVVGPAIRRTGGLAIANFGGWSQHPNVVAQWLDEVDGGMDEKFVKFAPGVGQGYRDAAGWLTQEREAIATQRVGKRFLAVTDAEPGDPSARQFGWTSLLLAADGRASYLAASAYSGAARPARPAAAALGPARGSMKRAGGGAWRRRFAGGLVIVNPTAAALRVRLGGRYRGAGSAVVTEATLPGRTGLVLRPAPDRRGAPWVIAAWSALVVLALIALSALHARRRHRAAESS